MNKNNKTRNSKTNTTEEKRVFVLSITGRERSDVAAILIDTLRGRRGTGKILCFDNSLSHDLFFAQNGTEPDPDTWYLEQGDVIYMRDRTLDPDKEAFQAFDIILMYHGLNIDYDVLQKSDYILFQTDFLPATLRLVKNCVDTALLEDIKKKFPEKAGSLYLDTGLNKVSEVQVLKELGFSLFDQDFSISMEEGYGEYMRLQYNRNNPGWKISKEYETVVSFIRDKVTKR